MKVKNFGNRGVMVIMFEKKFVLLEVNCIQNNVLKILWRLLFYELEYFMWIFGLLKIENVVKVLNFLDGE